MNEVHIPPFYVKLCKEWHGGQDTMMYAIASTGMLQHGTERPKDEYGQRYLTDSEWVLDLFHTLAWEIENILRSQVNRDKELVEFKAWVDQVMEMLPVD